MNPSSADHPRADQAATTETGVPPRFSPLHDAHVAAGASFTDFAGWQMPVRYTGDLAEHHAVRDAAGIFDVSHMANVTVRGPQAGAFLDYALAGSLSTVKPMQAKYSLLLDATGGIIDDLIVYHTGDDEYFIVPNAGNRDAVMAALTERAAGFDVAVADMSDRFAIFALQGPNAVRIIEAVDGLGVAEGEPGFAEVKNYRATRGRFADASVLVARTGYTGEDGFELYVDVAHATALWNAILAAGEPLGLLRAGLACRDTLRLEAGMPLYGHELGRDILPAQAGLARVVSLTKEGDFVGRAAIEAGPAPDARVLVGLSAEGRRAGRADYDIYPDAADDSAPGAAGATDAEPVGRITSGVLSPTLGHPIAMAFVDPAHVEPGSRLSVDIRGKRIPYTVTKLPFYSRKKI